MLVVNEYDVYNVLSHNPEVVLNVTNVLTGTDHRIIIVDGDVILDGMEGVRLSITGNNVIAIEQAWEKECGSSLTFQKQYVDLVRYELLDREVKREIDHLEEAAVDVAKHYSEDGNSAGIRMFILRDKKYQLEGKGKVIIVPSTTLIPPCADVIKGYTALSGANEIRYEGVQAWRYIEVKADSTGHARDIYSTLSANWKQLLNRS